MQKEDDTNVPTGDELFEHPVELASEDEHAPGDLGTTPKPSAGSDAQRRHKQGDRPHKKTISGRDMQRREY